MAENKLINIIPGKDVDFIVTDNSTAAIEPINDGNIVIYCHDHINSYNNNKKTHYNSTYIGGKHISEGYGLSTSEIRDRLETLDTTINNKIETIANQCIDIKLDEYKEGINTITVNDDIKYLSNSSIKLKMDNNEISLVTGNTKTMNVTKILVTLHNNTVYDLMTDDIYLNLANNTEHSIDSIIASVNIGGEWQNVNIVYKISSGESKQINYTVENNERIFNINCYESIPKETINTASDKCKYEELYFEYTPQENGTIIKSKKIYWILPIYYGALNENIGYKLDNVITTQVPNLINDLQLNSVLTTLDNRTEVGISHIYGGETFTGYEIIIIPNCLITNNKVSILLSKSNIGGAWQKNITRPMYSQSTSVTIYTTKQRYITDINDSIKWIIEKNY